MKPLTIATRRSELAVAQTGIVVSALRKTYPDIRIKIKKITTLGDENRTTPLWRLKHSGFFTSRLQEMLIAGRADLAVHSFKDLPVEQPDGLTIGAVCDRRYDEDVLIAAKPASSLNDLHANARIGTSSLRRIAQIKHLRSDLQTVSLRGNVTTRLARLKQGDFDAVVLARAGLERLGLSEAISFCFDPSEFIPAPAQGALAVQVRADDFETIKLIAAIDDGNARITTFAERKVLAVMQAGCHAPVAAFAKTADSDIIITAFASDLQGEKFIRRQSCGPVQKAERLAEQIAEQLLDAGAEAILEELKKQ